MSANTPLTLAELRWSLQSAADYLARLRDRMPSDTPEEAAYKMGLATGALEAAAAALASTVE
jgi:hypothetical protein